MKKIICLIILFCIQSVATADFNSGAKGTTTANFLKLGAGARAEAMGEAYSAVADDATALYWNPAGLTRIQANEASLMHAPYIDSTYYDYGAYAQRRENHAWGVGIQYFSAGSINETDANNAALGTFSPYDLAASAGYAYRFGENGPSVGVAGKYIHSKILDSASTFAMDLGAQSPLYWDRLRLAFAAANIGGKMKFEEESENLPVLLRYGSALKLTDHWLASFDLIMPKDNAPYAAFGTEYAWRVRDGITLAGRLGYNSLTAGDVSGVTGFAFGFGLGWDKFAFDYAFLPYGSLGITHRISISLKWGGDENDHSRSLAYPSDRENLP